jgi:hypothetical protein
MFLAVQSEETLPAAFGVELKAGGVKGMWSESEGDAKRASDYLSTESTVLLHHAAEALLRMYFAHAGSPDCPWMEIARMRAPSEFKLRVESFGREIESDETAASMMLVFTGHSSPNEKNRESWTEMRDALRLLLGHIQGVLLSDADVYNAAKHGLAVRAGEEGISFSISTPQIPLDTHGPSIAYLAAKEETDRWRWHRVTHWTHSDQNIGLIYVILSLMKNVWSVAKYRYGGGNFDASSLFLPTRKLADDLLAINAGKPMEGGGTLRIPYMSMSLLYYAESDSVTPTRQEAPNGHRK